MNNSLEHHGIQGMKWGVRRYQNYDGSLTQKGMKRYNKSLEKYEKTDSDYKNAKKSYKEGSGTKADLVNKKIARKDAKRQLEKDYNHLKQDKLADKGKERYAKGQTITNGREALGYITSLAGTASTAAVYANRLGIIDSKAAKNVVLTSAALTGSAYVASIVNDQTRNKQLRAYYAHTSNY